jgi:hypothetical protein
MGHTRHYWLYVDGSARLADRRSSRDGGLSSAVVVMVMVVVVMSGRGICWGSSMEEVCRTVKGGQSGGLFICLVAVMVVTRILLTHFLELYKAGRNILVMVVVGMARATCITC